jgi:superfamily II DNA helicase RecQ
MAFLTQFASFFISPFGEPTVCDELNKFLRSRRIVNVEKRLIDSERGTGWLFLVEYGEELKSQQPGGNARIDYRETLTQQEYVLFDKLRELRKTISEKQGVPVYAIFTNEQLANMAKSPPGSIKDFHSYSGVGEGRIKQYGEAFLGLFMNNQSV